jgi:tetratricopeptide (TPR) repeat protein
MLLGFLLGRVMAATPDDEYLRWFHELRVAEQWIQAGERDRAHQGLREALASLLAFEKAHPAWNPDLVAFRVRYLQEQIGNMESSSSTIEPSVGIEDALHPRFSTNSSARIEARLRELEIERDDLKARLREALEPRPAAGVTPELLRAQQLLRTQQKELDVLRFAAGQPAVEPGGRPQGRAVSGSIAPVDALMALARAAEAAPDSVQVLCRFGRALVDRGLIEPAEAVFRRALVQDADCGEVHLELARLCLRRTPPVASLARWHYQQARNGGIEADPALEAQLTLNQ